MYSYNKVLIIKKKTILKDKDIGFYFYFASVSCSNKGYNFYFASVSCSNKGYNDIKLMRFMTKYLLIRYKKRRCCFYNIFSPVFYDTYNTFYYVCG